MRNHGTTSALQAIVGPERNRYSARQVASAQRELELRAVGEQAAFERKVRLSANACMIIGAFFVVWPAVMLMAMRAGLSQPTPPNDPSAPFLFRHFDDLFVAIGLLQALCGALLCTGGAGTRAKRSFGPALISAVLIIGVVYVFSFTLASLPVVARYGWPFGAIFLAFMAVNDSLFLFLLWLPLRFFTSPRVRALCRGIAA